MQNQMDMDGLMDIQKPKNHNGEATSKGQDVAYIRVSSVDQCTDRQFTEEQRQGFKKCFIEKASAKDTKRPELKLCLSYLRDGDTLHVHSIDRLARNLFDLQKLLEILNSRGVEVYFHKEHLRFNGTNDPMQKLMLQMMGAFAEFERNLIRERQKEGIRVAKQKGKRIGAQSKLNPEQIKEIKQRVVLGESKSALAKAFGVSRQTLYSAIG